MPKANQAVYHSRHSMRWWCIKVVCGSLLIGGVLLKFIYSLQATWEPPILFGQGFTLLGFLMVFYHYLLLKRHNKNIEAPTVLITDQGLYRFIRHPMYLADLIWMLGLFLVFANPFSLLLFIFGAFALLKQAKEEDLFLQARFAQVYEQWRARTKLLVPALI